MICPNCNSDNTRSAKTIFESGTFIGVSTTKTNTPGRTVYSSFGDSVHIPGTTTTSTSFTSSQSIMAKKVNPPDFPKPKPSFFYLFVGVPILCFVILPIIMLIILQLFNVSMETSMFVSYSLAIFSFFKKIKEYKDEKKYREQIFPKEFAKWEQTWVCQKCGWVYVDPTTNIQ